MYLTPDEARTLGVPWVPRENEETPYMTPDEAASAGVPYLTTAQLGEAGPSYRDAAARTLGYATWQDLQNEARSGAVARQVFVDRLPAALVAQIETPTPADFAIGVLPDTELSSGSGWRDIVGGIGDIVGLLPIPGAGAIDRITDVFKPPAMQRPGGGGMGRLPLPGGGGRPQPQLPSGGGARPPVNVNVTAKLSPFINPRTGRNIPWRKVAKIGTLAAGAGLTVQQFIDQYGVPRDTPSLNPLNPSALRRAMRRTERFACFAKGAMQFAEKYRPGKRGSKKCGPKKKCS